MEKLALLAAAMTLALPAPLAFPTGALAAPNPGQVGNTGRYVPPFCKETLPTEWPAGMPMGRCVSVEETYFRNSLHGTQGFATQDCYQAEIFEPDLFWMTFDSFSDCVNWAHEFFGS